MHLKKLRNKKKTYFNFKPKHRRSGDPNTGIHSPVFCSLVHSNRDFQDTAQNRTEI